VKPTLDFLGKLSVGCSPSIQKHLNVVVRSSGPGVGGAEVKLKGSPVTTSSYSGNRDKTRLGAIVYWVIAIAWTDEKLNVIVFDYIANLIVIDDYFSD